MSIPVIPGFIEGPRGERLSEVWARPDGGFPDELWPLGVLEGVMPEPTGWLAGSNRDAALQRLGIRDMTTIEAFDHVAARLTHCLEQLTRLFENAAE